MKMTKNEAVHEWVSRFNSVPTNVVSKLGEFSDYEDMMEITPFEENEFNDYMDMYPMWGTMWAFNDSMDNEWLEDPNHLRAMKNCGFRIYQSEDYEYVFGINGAGYDFYEKHWEPLYDAVGLKWHEGAA